MNGPERGPPPATNESAGAETPLERELAVVEPARPSAGLRQRIAANLASAPVAPAGGRPLRGVVERLAWAFGGALAASFVLGLPAADSGRREVPERITAADQPVVKPVVSAGPLLSEETSRWADEGIRFLDDTTPARVLRRMVVERHRAPDGQAEVRVPRADVILLPVALQ